MNCQEVETLQGAAQGSPQDAAPVLSVLIVGYNTKQLVLDCLEGLFEHTRGLNYEVLFVDNSSDGSELAIREKFPRVRVIDNDENMGFGRGNNFLAQHAAGEYLLLLNPDTLVQNNAIGLLYEFAKQHPEGGAWGGVTRLPNGSVDPGCKQAGIGLGKSILLMIGLSKMACPDVTSGKVIDVPSLSGAFMLMPSSLWKQLGGFDETFFMYSEETDLCYRVRKSGRRVLITPKSSIVHLVGSGSSHSPKRLMSMNRGGMHLTRKHFGPVYIFLDGLIRWLHSAMRFSIGIVGLPLIGKERAARLRAAHAPIVFSPGQWFCGWSGMESKPEQKSELKLR